MFGTFLVIHSVLTHKNGQIVGIFLLQEKKMAYVFPNRIFLTSLSLKPSVTFVKQNFHSRCTSEIFSCMSSGFVRSGIRCLSVLLGSYYIIFKFCKYLSYPIEVSLKNLCMC